MNYDLYVAHPQGDEATQLRLLAAQEAPLNEYLSLIYGQSDKKKKQRLNQGKFNQLIERELARLKALGIAQATPPDVNTLPPGSWFLQFTFTLAKPWISKDDDPFYVAESVNPVRKDKVFKVPFMSAASWKGLLRWTLMHTRLAQKKDALTMERFAQERFVQTMLFGDEQGEESERKKGFAEYVDSLKPEARLEYERLLRAYYKTEADKPLPHHSGRLVFYPTFFNKIDVEVINPHSRETKAGTHPIYLECVPTDACGTFSLLYVPFDLVEHDSASTTAEAGKHLRYLAPAIRELFITYGFSAKRTSGYGMANDTVKGAVSTRAGEKFLTHLNHLASEVKDVTF